MATVTAETQTVITSVQLTLNKAEVELLRDILGNITGSATSRRHPADALYRVLNDISGLAPIDNSDIDKWLHFRDGA